MNSKRRQQSGKPGSKGHWHRKKLLADEPADGMLEHIGETGSFASCAEASFVSLESDSIAEDGTCAKDTEQAGGIEKQVEHFNISTDSYVSQDEHAYPSVMRMYDMSAPDRQMTAPTITSLPEVSPQFVELASFPQRHSDSGSSPDRKSEGTRRMSSRLGRGGLMAPMDVAQINSPPCVPRSPPRRLRTQKSEQVEQVPITSSIVSSPPCAAKSSTATPTENADTLTQSSGGLVIRQQVCGAMLASVVAEILIYPLDTIKLLQQIHGRGPLELARELLQSHGIRGFYQGLFSRLLQTLLSNGVFFFFQTLFKNKSRNNSISHSLLLNMVAQQMNRLLTTPFEVVANVNQSDPNATGFISTVLKIWRSEGIQSFWKGLGVSLILSSNPAFMFTLVDRLTSLLTRMKGRNSGHPQNLVSAGEMFFVSGTAKMVATLLTYPLIRAKVLLQTSKGGTVGLFAMLRKTLREGGMRGLYVGVWTMSWKTIMFNALMMAIKQKILEMLVPKPKSVQADALARNPQDSGSSRFRRKLECLGNSLPYDCSGTVVYIDGAWSYLHPSHQHMLAEAQSYGAYVVVGVHSEHTRLQWNSGNFLERYENRLARIRLVRGVDAILHDAPWIVTRELLHDLNISKVLSGYQQATAVDPYAVPKQLGIYTSLADPYSGFWRQVVHVMFSNVDASDGQDDFFPFRGCEHDYSQTLFRGNSTGSFTLRRTNSWYFYYATNDATTIPPAYSRRGRHLAQAKQRRDCNTCDMDNMVRASKAGVQHALDDYLPVKLNSPCIDNDDDDFNNFELPAPKLKVEFTASKEAKTPLAESTVGDASASRP